MGANLNERKGAIILLILSSILWSLGGVFIKLVNLNPIAIAGFRSIISAIFIILVTRRFKFDFSKDQIICAIFYSLTVFLFVGATKLTTAASAIMLQYTAPIYVAFLSYALLKERILMIDWISSFFVIIGMLLFFIGKLSFNNLLGNLLAILSGISFAGLAIFMRKQKDKSPIDSIIIGNILTGIVALPFSFNKVPDKFSIFGLILLGTIQLGLPYMLYSRAIKSINAFEAVLIPVIEPILNPIWTLIVLNERPTVWTIFGGTIVLLSVTLNQIYKINTAKKLGDAYGGQTQST